MEILKNRVMMQFYDIVVRPFTEPFLSIVTHTVSKLAMAFFYFVIMVLSTFFELIDTPEEYWVGLMVLASLDFLFGTLRAIMEPELKFDVHIFVRGVYKLCLVYPAALIVSAIATNMFPTIFGLFQYLFVAVMVSLETWSFFRNVKLLAVLYAIMEIMKDRLPGSDKFLDIVNRKDKELLKESEKYKRRPHSSGGSEETANSK